MTIVLSQVYDSSDIHEERTFIIKKHCASDTSVACLQSKNFVQKNLGWHFRSKHAQLKHKTRWNKLADLNTVVLQLALSRNNLHGIMLNHKGGVLALESILLEGGIV